MGATGLIFDNVLLRMREYGNSHGQKNSTGDSDTMATRPEDRTTGETETASFDDLTPMQAFSVGVFHAMCDDDDPSRLAEMVEMKGTDIDVDMIWEDHARPLHYAVSHGAVKTLKALLEYGADCESLNGRGRTPLDHALADGLKDAVAILESFGACTVAQKRWLDANAEDKARDIVAALGDRPDAARLLARDENGLSALHVLGAAGRLGDVFTEDKWRGRGRELKTCCDAVPGRYRAQADFGLLHKRVSIAALPGRRLGMKPGGRP